jgi:hypothetical protein
MRKEISATEPRSGGRVLAFFTVWVVLSVACQAPSVVVAPTSTMVVATLTPLRTVGVAVAVASPTATAVVVGDYPTLVGQRVGRVQQGLGRLEQQLGLLKAAPIRMAEDDWRNQTQSLLDDLATASADLRSLGARTGPDAALYSAVLTLLDDLDFVVSEYRMALDFDPDSTHFLRAGTAEKTTADEVESLLTSLRRPVGPALTPSFAR